MVRIESRDIPQTVTIERTYAPTEDGLKFFRTYGYFALEAEKQNVESALRPTETGYYGGAIWSKSEEEELFQIVDPETLKVRFGALESLANLEGNHCVMGIKIDAQSREVLVTKTPNADKARMWIAQDEDSMQRVIELLVISNGLGDKEVLMEELQELPAGTLVLEVNQHGTVTKFYNGFIITHP